MNENRIATYLVVEDEPMQSCLLEKWLLKAAKPIEIKVYTADNLADGISLSNQVRPISTFLDMHIPLEKGGPVCEDWRKIADGSTLMVPPVIGITGYDITADMRIYCITERKMDHLLQKPLNEGFFAQLKSKGVFFAAELIKLSSDAALRAPPENGNGDDKGT